MFVLVGYKCIKPCQMAPPVFIVVYLSSQESIFPELLLLSSWNDQFWKQVERSVFPKN